MSVRSEAAKLIKMGRCPNDVAKELGKTDRINKLIRLILTSVGEGNLLLSEIYFSIPDARLKHFQRICEDVPEITLSGLTNTAYRPSSQWSPTRNPKVSGLGPDHGPPKRRNLFAEMQSNPIVFGLDPDHDSIELKLYWYSKDSPYTDTYRFLRELETTLFRMIQKTLDLRYFPSEMAWWDKGVSEKSALAAKMFRNEIQVMISDLGAI